MWKFIAPCFNLDSNVYAFYARRSRINTIAVEEYGVIEPDTVLYLISMAVMLASS